MSPHLLQRCLLLVIVQKGIRGLQPRRVQEQPVSTRARANFKHFAQDVAAVYCANLSILKENEKLCYRRTGEITGEQIVGFVAQ
jgi:hypothetical protein